MSQRIAALVVFTCLSSSVLQAQQYFRQPWDQYSNAHESRVESCANPVPTDLIGLDDFRFQQSGTLDGIIFWGKVLDSAQIESAHGYYVAIYDDNGACGPGALLHSECITPASQFAFMDCTGDSVYRFVSPLTGGFQVTGGENYWLQVSEIDDESANVGVDDFLWSNRLPLRMCPAAQMDSSGNLFQPLFDICSWQQVDFSFILRAS